MNTITLTPEAYQFALISANKVKTSVEDWVNKVLLNIIASNPTATKENREQTAKPEMYSWREMEGMFATDKSDKELLDEYLSEKYGL